MNILVTSLNLDISHEVAIKLSKRLHLKFVNANEVFNKTLLKSINEPTLLVDEELNEKESELCQKLSKMDGAVIAMSDDMFLANSNYDLFKNSHKVLISSKNLGRTKKNIEKLIQTHCNYIISQDEISNLIEKFKG